GARLWNASVATGIPIARYASLADTVMMCFSKGLGAPVGSVLAGPAAVVRRARRFRKMLGGGIRQGGVLAAACLHALDHHVDPLGVTDSWRTGIEETRRRVVREIKQDVEARGYPRVALGLSGGLDSAVTAALCVEALGADNVLGVLMPLRTTDPSSLSIAQGL